MKHLLYFIWLLVFIFCSEASAQKVTYTYDNAGNRIKRETELSSQGKPASQQNRQEIKPASDMLAYKDIRIHPQTNHRNAQSGNHELRIGRCRKHSCLQNGNSVTGKGWSLSGVSSIRRTVKNLYYDGLADGVRMNGNDAFTFDGVRLIKTDASDKSCIIYESEYGHILDTSNSLIAEESVGTSLSNGLYGALTDSNIDGVTGGVEGGVLAVNPGRYFFSGKYTNRTLIQRAATFSSNANVSRIVGLAIRSY